MDIAIDDRDRPIGWKLNDADLVGYPFIVVMGKAWRDRQVVELQCRQLRIKEEVHAPEIRERIQGYAKQLEMVHLERRS